MLRLAAGHKAEPSAAVLDSRTLRATLVSGKRAGYDGAKRKQGTKLHMAVDTLGDVLALHATPASADARAQGERLAKAVQAATDDNVEIAFVDQGYNGEKLATAAPVRHRIGGREATRGQARLRVAAQTLGRGTLLRLGHPLPPARHTRFRESPLPGDQLTSALQLSRMFDAVEIELH